ncbi:MAG: hypothetical protein CMJ83_08330 [Planctomycetes bacterium]|nr:hypothetical protein [Planctomycetota bacterium]
MPRPFLALAAATALLAACGDDPGPRAPYGPIHITANAGDVVVWEMRIARRKRSDDDTGDGLITQLYRFRVTDARPDAIVLERRLSRDGKEVPGLRLELGRDGVVRAASNFRRNALYWHRSGQSEDLLEVTALAGTYLGDLAVADRADLSPGDEVNFRREVLFHGTFLTVDVTATLEGKTDARVRFDLAGSAKLPEELLAGSHNESLHAEIVRGQLSVSGEIVYSGRDGLLDHSALVVTLSSTTTEGAAITRTASIGLVRSDG